MKTLIWHAALLTVQMSILGISWQVRESMWMRKTRLLKFIGLPGLLLIGGDWLLIGSYSFVIMTTLSSRRFTRVGCVLMSASTWQHSSTEYVPLDSLIFSRLEVATRFFFPVAILTTKTRSLPIWILLNLYRWPPKYVWESDIELLSRGDFSSYRNLIPFSWQ